jgi:hypothetical protein
MSNTENKTNTETENKETIETVETIALDNVTGGCSRCGCGRPDANPAAFSALAASFQR